MINSIWIYLRPHTLRYIRAELVDQRSAENADEVNRLIADITEMLVDLDGDGGAETR